MRIAFKCLSALFDVLASHTSLSSFFLVVVITMGEEKTNTGLASVSDILDSIVALITDWLEAH